MKNPFLENLTKQDFLDMTKEDYLSIDIDILKAQTISEIDRVQRGIDRKLINEGGPSSIVKEAKLRELYRIIKGIGEEE